MNTKIVLLVIAALVAFAQATACVDQVCRCRSGSVEVGSRESGCYTCYCESTAAPATSTAATTKATTTKATTARLTTAAATTLRATTKAATTTARPTTAQCGPLPECGCSSSDVIVWSTDAKGCPSTCQCTAASTVRATTAAPTTVRATTAAAPTCPPAQPCACFRTTDIQTFVTDSNGCRSCVCVAAPTTVAPAPVTVRASTTAATCAPWALRDNCNCAPGTVKYYRTDAWGCLVCGCQAVTTTTRVTTTRATTAAPTTTRATTAAPTTTRATTRAAVTAAPTTARATAAAATTKAATTPVASASCGTARQCRCASGAVIMWDVDSNGCPYCYCAAAGASGLEATSSGSSGSSSSSTSTVIVPVVATVGCVGTLLVALVAVFHYKSKNGRFPWASAEAESVEARV